MICCFTTQTTAMGLTEKKKLQKLNGGICNRRFSTALCPHLASMRLSTLSSHCSDTVSNSCRRAMAFSTELCGANPTP